MTILFFRFVSSSILIFNKIDVSFPCVCPVIDHESRYSIFEVVDLQATLTILIL